MAFIKVKDLYDTIECVAFPKTFMTIRAFCLTEKLVVIKGKVSDRNGEFSILIDDMKELK